MGIDFLIPGMGGKGKLRAMLLRLRASKPEKFADGKLPDGIPLKDDDIDRNPFLRELVRTAQIESGHGDLVTARGFNLGPMGLWGAGGLPWACPPYQGRLGWGIPRG